MVVPFYPKYRASLLLFCLFVNSLRYYVVLYQLGLLIFKIYKVYY